MKDGFVVNQYEPCVFNKGIAPNQTTVTKTPRTYSDKGTRFVEPDKKIGKEEYMSWNVVTTVAEAELITKDRIFEKLRNDKKFFEVTKESINALRKKIHKNAENQVIRRKKQVDEPPNPTTADQKIDFGTSTKYTHVLINKELEEFLVHPAYR